MLARRGERRDHEVFEWSEAELDWDRLGDGVAVQDQVELGGWMDRQ